MTQRDSATVSVGCDKLAVRPLTIRQTRRRAPAHQNINRTSGEPRPTALWCAWLAAIIVRAGSGSPASLSHPTVTARCTNRARLFRNSRQKRRLGIAVCDQFLYHVLAHPTILHHPPCVIRAIGRSREPSGTGRPLVSLAPARHGKGIRRFLAIPCSARLAGQSTVQIKTASMAESRTAS